MSASSPRATQGQGRLYDSVVDTIGNTPSIRINNLAPDHVELYVKAEYLIQLHLSKIGWRSALSRKRSEREP